MNKWKTTIALLALLSLCGCNPKTDGRFDVFFSPSGKKLTVIPIKHASLQLNFDGVEFEIDPVCSHVEPIVEYIDKPKADFILITHAHNDHFDPYAIHVLLDPKKTNIICDSVSNRLLHGKGIVLRNGQRADLGRGMSVTAIPAYNTDKKLAKIHPKGRDNGYLLDLDGLRVYIAGDTELTPEMRHLGKVDIAFLPCNRPYTMTLAQLRKAAEVIRPKVLYPYNFGRTRPEDIARTLAHLPGTEVRMKDMR